MIDLNLYLYDQIDALLAVAIESVSTDNWLVDDVTEVMVKTDSALRQLAVDCEALGKPQRQRQLIYDLAAVSWLYRQLQNHASIAKNRADTGTIGYAADAASRWSKSVGKVGEALAELRQTAQGFGSTLGGIAALEMVLTGILDRIEKESKPEKQPVQKTEEQPEQQEKPRQTGYMTSYRRLAMMDAKALISTFFAKARMDAIGGIPSTTNILSRLDAVMVAESESLIAADGELWAWHFEEAFDERVARDAKIGVFTLIRLLLDSEVRGSKLMTWASDVSEDITKLKAGGNRKIVPSPQMAMVWALCRLVDGWQPRQIGSDPLALVEINPRVQDGYIPVLARTLVETVLGGETKERSREAEENMAAPTGGKAFSKNMLEDGTAFLANRTRGGKKRPFHGRRWTGKMAGEIERDALDQPEQAPVKVRWPGDPAKVPQIIKTAAIASAARAAKD